MPLLAIYHLSPTFVVSLTPAAPVKGNYSMYSEGETRQLYTGRFQTWDPYPATGYWSEQASDTLPPGPGISFQNTVGLRIANAPSGKLYLVDIAVMIPENDGTTNCRFVTTADYQTFQTTNCALAPENPGPLKEQHILIAVQGNGTYETMLEMTQVADPGKAPGYRLEGFTVTPVN